LEQDGSASQNLLCLPDSDPRLQIAFIAHSKKRILLAFSRFEMVGTDPRLRALPAILFHEP
jgi:hypothetical protein